MTTTTAPITTIPALPAGAPGFDRLVMHVGLALLLWGRRHAAAPRTARPERPELAGLAGDARWYMH